MDMYSKKLFGLLTVEKENTIKEEEVLFNLYTILISLNNNNYTKEKELEDEQIIRLFLTKINNLKVKIQLKRKDKEINKLIKDIEKNYELEEEILYKHISNKEDLFNIINSKGINEINNLIDTKTKSSYDVINNIDNISILRNKIISSLIDNKCKLEDNKVLFDTDSISLEKFYDLFSYLLNIANYPDMYKSVGTNSERKKLIKLLINTIKTKSIDSESYDKIIIPLVLSYLIKENGIDESIKTDDFIVENIKILDLYSFKNKTDKYGATTKWKNFNIPNEYLFNKIKEIVKSGMYYYNQNKLVLELVEDKVSDFKVSIEIDKMKDYIINNLSLIC